MTEPGNIGSFWYDPAAWAASASIKDSASRKAEFWANLDMFHPSPNTILVISDVLSSSLGKYVGLRRPT
jgi:hypothetical protein